jgi:L-alanine-DL-glutamate epimerase-like enolase superfamily enzyme
MQITNVRVTPVELELKLAYRTARHAGVDRVTVLFIQLDTQAGRTAWGCAAFDPELTGETREQVTTVCHACADRVRDLSPLNTEYALAVLEEMTQGTPSVQCAFDMAFYDLLGLASGLPLYRLLGGYRDRILTSVTINVGTVNETVSMARHRARQGFRILKLKGGVDADLDVRRVRAVRDALPHCTLRLDADQGYTVEEALEVTRALADLLEMLEQPTPADDLDALRQVTARSAVPILADESIVGPQSALQIAARRAADGLSVKLATCGGLRCARQIDAIARSARLATMVGCINEPALLVAAGLGFALSSPNVRYGDLDGHLDLVDDPSRPRFLLQDGYLVATDVPGLGCTVSL